MRPKNLTAPLCALIILSIAIFEAAAVWMEDGNLVEPGDYYWRPYYLTGIVPDGSGGAIMAWTELYWGPGDQKHYEIQKIDSDGIIQWPPPPYSEDSFRGSLLESDDAGDLLEEVSPANLILLASDDAGGAFYIYHGTGFMGWYSMHLSRIFTDGSSSHIDFWDDPTYEDGFYNCTYDIIPDGMGGAILVWEGTFFHDFYGGAAGIFLVAQKIDSGNNRQWGDSGIYVCTDPNGKSFPRVVPDGAGGVIIIWLDYRDDGDIYAQRLNGSGTVLWAADGVPIMTAGNPQSPIRMISDGSGGAIFVWEDERNGNTDIYAQRIDGSGGILWAADGLPVCTAAGDQIGPELVTDDTGGAIISWCDPRSGDLDVYAQRIDASGTAQWGTNGFAIASGVGDQQCGRIEEYGMDGAVIVYVDDSSGEMNIRAQHVDDSGVMHWGPNGICVCSVAGDKDNILMTSDGAGGSIIAWEDKRDSEWDAIYASRITYPVTTDDTVEPSAATMLDQNHPNPFNPSTTVSFSLSSPSHASLKIYDASGRFVRTLLDEQCSAGTHEKNWDGRDESGREVSSGVYFCRIAVGDFTETRKMVLLR